MNLNRKLNKKDISAPLSDTFQQLTNRGDSANYLPEIETNEPFFDASASQVGGPQDPRVIKAMRPPQKLSARQLQSFVQAVGAFRRQIQAMGAASEMFVRSCEALKECVPAANIRDLQCVEDLDFLIDSTHLVSNAHQIWSSNLQSEFEEPLINHLSDIKKQSGNVERDNKGRIDELTLKLHKEEDNSYKLGRKKQRDLETLKNSLNVRMSLADEIKRLSMESQTVQDSLCASSTEFVLKQCSIGVRKELETYEIIMEGLKKLGGYDTVVKRRETASTILDNVRF
ncbi:hypothetical protein HK099_006283 [Clydaea vesicula]|uniref:Uncharacterized protein n=1 Tax=Clydaea vesicula TaxID=447962 RepID=A0AAD5XZ69_9FUNG|nr:hypothetical protein HK099_006283 [Clydaea vesicula]KAJ3382113.1 hypothetical protein HDU92_004927 [Lobulomyces angularis]